MKLTIERLGHLGDGIAAGPVYVPRTLPGEVVEGEVEQGRIAAPRIETPSPDRVTPPCRHYRTCGGCHLQHASDDFVAAWKAGIARTALEAQGLPAPIRGVVTSPARSRRRATLSGRRLKRGVIVGFHGRASDTLVAVPDCELLDPAIIAAFPVLESLTEIAATRRSEVSIAVTVTESGLDVALRDAVSPDRTGIETAAALAESGDLARLSWNGEPIAERRPPVLTLGTAQVVLPPGAFLQATKSGEAALVAAVVEAVGPARRIADLFAGCGTFALPLARRAEVHAVEGEAEMLAALDRGWRRAEGLKRVSTETRDLFRRPLTADEIDGFDAVVIDPPRAGALAQTREIARSRIGRLAAVSCHPQSFARDAKALVEAGFRLEWVQVVDQFRWSPHVELAASFVRDHMGG